jgi:hypothetical protein
MTKHTVTRIFVRSVLGIAELQQPEAHGPPLCVPRHAGLRCSNRVPHGPDLCVLGMKPLRSHRSVPSEFRSADASQTYATSFVRFARKL